MAKYNYECSSDEGCSGVTERIQPMADDLPKSIPCKFCGKDATLPPVAPAVSRSGMGNEPLDIAIGRASAARHAEIGQRQAARNKVRVGAGQQGLKATGYNDFEPISTVQRLTRTRALDLVEKDGYRPDPKDPFAAFVPGPKTK